MRACVTSDSLLNGLERRRARAKANNSQVTAALTLSKFFSRCGELFSLSSYVVAVRHRRLSRARIVLGSHNGPLCSMRICSVARARTHVGRSPEMRLTRAADVAVVSARAA